MNMYLLVTNLRSNNNNLSRGYINREMNLNNHKQVSLLVIGNNRVINLNLKNITKKKCLKILLRILKMNSDFFFFLFIYNN
mmetsp:Transcript_425/g.74  ORF Transcript_425/g.74 Transcript_425/m.74 type:complete len:81 (-) Transcript_425:9-251(-)